MCDHLWVLLGHMVPEIDAVRCRFCGVDALVECQCDPSNKGDE